MTRTRLVALDTETTGLDPETEDVFEIATVELDTGTEKVWRIEPRPSVVAAMHPKAVEVNRYHERIADPEWTWEDTHFALGALFVELAGAHIVGAVPDFDTRHLTGLYQRLGHPVPRWHYHLIDVETLAVGWLHGRSSGYTPRTRAKRIGPAGSLPWRSDDLSLACGVDPPAEDERHTALGDARWVARWYRHLTGEVAS